MKRCENCRVLLPDNQKNCPLCHRSLPGGPEETVLPNPDFPAYPQVQLKKFRAVFFRIALFLSAAAGIVTLFINWMTWEQVPRLWSLFVIIPLLYLWLLVGNTILSRMPGGAKIILHTLGLSCVLLAMDLLTGYHRWSVNWAIPFLMVAATVLMTILVFARKLLWNAYIGYAITMIPLGFLPLLLYACKVSRVFWASAVPALCSLLALLAMAIFARKRFRSEVVRRFHF